MSTSNLINKPIFVGIDPGIQGAITILDESGEILGNGPINPAQFIAIAHKYKVWNVIIEKQWGRPGDSPKRIGVLLVDYGRIKGIFEAWKLIFTRFKINLSEITPQKWQGLMHRGISRKHGPKTRSDMAFAEHFPEKKLHKYAIDSALIAEYARKTAPKTD